MCFLLFESLSLVVIFLYFTICEMLGSWSTSLYYYQLTYLAFKTDILSMPISFDMMIVALRLLYGQLCDDRGQVYSPTRVSVWRQWNLFLVWAGRWKSSLQWTGSVCEDIGIHPLLTDREKRVYCQISTVGNCFILFYWLPFHSPHFYARHAWSGRSTNSYVSGHDQCSL